MAADRPSTWRGYLIGAGAAALAWWVSCALWETRTPVMPGIAVVLIVSWKCGRGPGILTMLIYSVISGISFFSHHFSEDDANFWRNIGREITFLGVNTVGMLIATAYRTAEADAREHAEWLSFTLANISNGVIVADAKGKITFINPIAQRLTGFGDEAVGMPAAEVFKIAALDSKKELENPIVKALRERVPARFDASQGAGAILISKDGRRYIIEDSATSVTATGGQNAVLVFRDVTEQRRIEAEQRGAAQRLRLALDVGKLIAWEWNAASDELISDDWEKLLPGAAIHSRADLIHFVHPEDREMMQQIPSALMGESKSYVAEYRLIRPDGEIIWIESRGQPFRNDRGELVRVLGVIRDKTEQKLVEKIVREGQEQFRNVAESATDGFVTTDDKGRILYANGACAAIFGYARAELMGQPLTVLIPERLRAAYGADFENYCRLGEKELNWDRVEIPGLRKDGGEIPVEMSFSQSHTGQKRLITAIVRDISKRKKDEEAMLAARERLELAQRIAGLGTYHLDMRTGIANLSPELTAMYGLSPGAFSGEYEAFEKLLHPDDVETMRKHVRAMRDDALPEYGAEYRIVWPDASMHWFASKTKVFRGEHGEALWALGVVLDVTREREADAEREKLLESERAARERLSLAHRISGIGSYEMDLTTGKLEMSPESLLLYGFAPGEIAPTRELWRTSVHPDDRERVEGSLQKALESDAADWQEEYRIGWPDKSLHWITTKARIFRDEHAKALKLLGAEQDIARQKETENERERHLVSEKVNRERLELAQRAAGIGTYERDLKTGVLKLSPDLLAQLGLSPRDFSGRYEDWIALIHPEDRRHLLLSDAEAERRKGEYYIEYRVIWPSGGVRWLASSGKVICDSRGNPELSIGATLDITEHKAIEAQREHIIDREKAARAEAERASRLKDEFLATVSHELRTPLTAVLGWSKMLLDGELDNEMSRRGLESIDRNARAQARLVEDLLDVSRIVTGRMRINLQPVDLSEIVAAAVDGVRPAAQAKKIELNLKLDPARVSGDADRLQQVIFNILSNAVKFSTTKSRVDVIVQTDYNHARCIVSDHGKGIDPEFLPNLFQRFTQEDGSSTRRHGGMGLGLAIVRHLVELHGGTVRAESEGEGQGTTLIVELPLLKQGDSGMFDRRRENIVNPLQAAQVEGTFHWPLA